MRSLSSSYRRRDPVTGSSKPCIFKQLMHWVMRQVMLSKIDKKGDGRRNAGVG